MRPENPRSRISSAFTLNTSPKNCTVATGPSSVTCSTGPAYWGRGRWWAFGSVDALIGNLIFNAGIGRGVDDDEEELESYFELELLDSCSERTVEIARI